MTPSLLDRRLAHLILADVDFTADDLTGDGQVAVDPSHKPNGRQNAIGSIFRAAHAAGWITPTGQGVRSRAPHRKGGLIRVWHGTDLGRRHARAVLADAAG